MLCNKFTSRLLICAQFRDKESYDACQFADAEDLNAKSPFSWKTLFVKPGVYYFGSSNGDDCKSGVKIQITVTAKDYADFAGFNVQKDKAMIRMGKSGDIKLVRTAANELTIHVRGSCMSESCTSHIST